MTTTDAPEQPFATPGAEQPFAVPAAEPAPPAAPAPAAPARASRPFRLVRLRAGRKLGGVCAGIAREVDIDVTLIRVGFLAAAFAGFGIPLYLAAWILAPVDDVTA